MGDFSIFHSLFALAYFGIVSFIVVYLPVKVVQKVFRSILGHKPGKG